MQKGSNSPRGRTRSGTPKTPRTIDLEPGDVKETAKTPKADEAKSSAGGDKTASKPETPPAEPVAMEKPASDKSATGDSSPKKVPAGAASGHSGFGPSAASATPKAAATESGAWGRGSASASTVGSAKPTASDKPPASPRKSGGAGLAAIIASGFAGALIALLLIGGLNAAGVLKYVPLVGSLATSQTAAPTVPDLTADVAALDKRLAALEEASRAPTPRNPELGAIVDDLSSRLAQTETALRDLRARTGEAPTDNAAVEALRSQVNELTQKVATVTGQASQANSAGDSDALAAMGDKVTTVSGDVQSLDERLSALSNDVDSMKTTIATLQNTLIKADAARDQLASQQQTANAVATEALRAAYRRGEPFGELIDSLEALTGQNNAIDALKPFAATGVPTDAEIVSDFDHVAGRILAASGPKGDGVVSRLLSNARSLISVRPEGPVEGNTPAAIVSRIAASLENGAYTQALNEWQALPDEAKSVSMEWSEKLQRRIAADKLMDEVAAGLGSTAPAN